MIIQIKKSLYLRSFYDDSRIPIIWLFISQVLSELFIANFLDL